MNEWMNERNEMGQSFVEKCNAMNEWMNEWMNWKKWNGTIFCRRKKLMTAKVFQRK
jgi:hypothetical protein